MNNQCGVCSEKGHWYEPCEKLRQLNNKIMGINVVLPIVKSSNRDSQTEMMIKKNEVKREDKIIEE